jgi:8-oxo-dGTP pyrophosphatase MutT (NUDIX family)
VILLDPDGRVLLACGHDVDRPERSWWFTIGGGIEPGESDRAAAVREVREETGMVLDPAALVGPVLTRSAIFDFARVTCLQDETFFLARLGAEARLWTLDRSGWTSVEHGFMDEMRWWAPADLRSVQIETFPAELADIVEELGGGWDGQARHLGLAREM